MNYLLELRAFKDWCLINQPPCGQIVLWHALMMAANTSGWQEWVSVPGRTLELLSGLSHSGINNARKGLMDRNRIEYRPSDNRKKASKYKIIPFIQELPQKKNECENELGNELKNENRNESESQQRTSERTLSKQDNKQNETKQKNIYTPEFEKWYAEYPRPQAKQDSFKNFEKVRKSKGIDFILQCTRNYIDYYNSLPERDREYAYSSNNFLGQKAYYKDYLEPKYYRKVVDIDDESRYKRERYTG